MLKKIKNFILDLFFPQECLICGQEGTYFCLTCQKKISTVNDLCFICNKKNSDIGICETCQKSVNFDELYVGAHYRQTVLEKIIREFKFNYVEELAEPLAKLLCRKVRQKKLDLTDCLVVAVPLHKKRLCERGFNQAFLLAKNFAQKQNAVLLNEVLVRQKNTRQQAKLSKADRMSNLTGAFVVENAQYIKNKKIILIDDVVTTAATLCEAAKALKSAGASKVIALAVAHE